MVVRHAVRVARALALLSGGACSGVPATFDDEGSSVRPDAALEASPRDAVGGAARIDGPSCIDAEDQTSCEPGLVCEVDIRYGLMQCVALDAGLLKPCGLISCGWLCACSDPATSTCRCYTDSGPLPPPDLPT